LLQEISAARASSPVLIQLVVPSVGEGASLRGLWALLKSAAQENPRIVAQGLAIDTTCLPHELAQRLALEAREPVGREVRYLGGQRQVLQLAPIETMPAPASIWRDGGVYLVTGGLGGLGRLLVGDIIRHVASARLVLTGRSALDTSAHDWLQALRVQGHSVDYRELDVSDVRQQHVLVHEIVAMHGRLDGIVHAAGSLCDGLLIKKTEADLQAVLAPKVAGLVALDEATAHLALDCFILFSSASALAGNPGQTDYAAANAFMDAYAQYRNELVAAGVRHGRTLSINWPLWAEGGMQVDDLVRERLRRATGMVPLETADGLQALHQAYALPGAQIAVLNGELSRFKQGQGSAPTAVPAPAAKSSQPVSVEERASSLAVAGETPSGDLSAAAVTYVCGLISDGLKLPANRPLDANAPLDQYGIDSIMVTELTGRLETVFGSLPKTLFFEYQTAAELAGYLLESKRDTLVQVVGMGAAASARPLASKPLAAGSTEAFLSGRLPLASRPGNKALVKSMRTEPQQPAATLGRSASGPLDIAIIGVAGRYPKARNLAEFWDKLTQGVNCVTEIPPERWSLDGFFDPQRGRLGRSYTKWGGFIEGMDEFDPAFFGMSELDAQIMDPQERLFLQCVHDALEDAGYTRETMVKRHQALGLLGNVGVFVGTMYMEYQLHAAQAQERGEGFGLNGLAASMANRVSYAFNFHGPSLSVDAMCSASLTAIHLAAHSLLRGECEVAIAGGVNLNLHPNKFLVMSQGQFASSEGLCRSFGDGGDGYVASEGVGAVLLKPLAQAIADGDQIHAVIKGSALSHSGKTSAYTVPNPNAQAQAVRHALLESGLPAQAVSYIEAHGTGTVLGDPIEIAALGRVYGEASGKNGWLCPIGSVKSNIGHCESAGGIAGLTKVLLQMRHRKLVPSLHSRDLNGNIDFERAPFHVQQSLADWVRPKQSADGREQEWPLTAAISSYGAGGSNAHMIVQEHVDSRPRAADEVGTQALVLSARSPQALREQAQRLLQAVRVGSFQRSDLADIAYTLQIGREAMDCRLAFVVSSLHDLVLALEAWLAPEAEPTSSVTLLEGNVSSGRDALGALHSDADLQDVMKAWARNGKFEKLLQLWVQGVPFDWAALHEGGTPRRISLPTYAFARSRYWMPQLSKEEIRGGLLVEGSAEIGVSSTKQVTPQMFDPDRVVDDEPDVLTID
jgi:polyketide synthase PksN